MIPYLNDAREEWPSIISITMDSASSTATIVTADNHETSFPMLLSPFEPSDTIVRSTYYPKINRLYLMTHHGDTVAAEIPTLSNSAPRNDRPVIYLDQRDWSLLANCLHEPERIRLAVQHDAAEQLIALARETKIILPMSLGHMAETARWSDNKRRYHLALTLAELSRGWQMRHPLDIRRYELQQSIATRIKHAPLPPLDVFTLEGCAAESEPRSDRNYGTRTGLSMAVAHAVDALTCISSYFAAILDSEALERNPIPGWVSENQTFTNWLAKQSRTSSQKRKSIWARFLADLGLEPVHAALRSGLSRSEMEAWLETYFDGDIRTMASLGLFNEIYQDKHLNQRTVWHINDLRDMMFITCGAGYADYVLGERSMVSHVRQAARRLHREIHIYSDITDLLFSLKSAGL